MAINWQSIVQEFPTHFKAELTQLIDSFESLPGVYPLIEESSLAKQKELLQVCLLSDYVKRLIFSEPTWLEDVLSWLDDEIQDTPFYVNLQIALAKAEDEAELKKALRLFRKQFMLHMIWRDLNQKADLLEVMRTHSAFADFCVEQTLSKAYLWYCLQDGPRFSDGTPMSLIVLALGKLGGNELNLSSDIDLVMTYAHEGKILSGEEIQTHNEFFTNIVQFLARVLSETDENGFVFRVDLRLRPYGESGPVVMSFPAMEQYYQEQGRDWERYAMIKARAITGRPREVEPVLEMINQFVYRRYIDYAAIVSLREMKASIVRSLALKKQQDNIKTGAGGIRDVEFIGQAHQLLHGGKCKPLRQREIQTTLLTLNNFGYLKPAETQHLLKAYVFLRLVEHRLQAYTDQQTQRLPKQALEQSKLAHSMCYASWDEFNAELKSHRNIVKEIFSSLSESEDIDDYVESEAEKKLSLVWQSLDEKEECLNILTPLFAKESDTIYRTLFDFYQLSAQKKISQTARGRLNKLMPMVLGILSGIEEPKKTLTRIIDLILSIIRRSSYLLLLIENPHALNQCIKLCAASAWFSSEISKYPMLLDELIDPVNLSQLADGETLKEELELSLVSNAHNTEETMQYLREYKKTYEIKVAAREISEILPLMKVSDQLTLLAEVMLNEVVRIAWQDIKPKFQNKMNVTAQVPPICIVAYGKLAGFELSYTSDLDIIFLYDSALSLQLFEADMHAVNELYVRLSQRISHLLATMTETGVLYRVDTRLRPSGESGLIASTLKAYEDYQLNSAWIWEHQALVRSRVVVGDDAMRNKFNKIRSKVLTLQRDEQGLKEAVIEMRRKMLRGVRVSSGEFDLKLSVGAMTDIEFISQYLVLNYAHLHPRLLTYPDNIRILEIAAEEKLIEQSTSEKLINIYLDYREKSHRFALQNLPSVIQKEEVNSQSMQISSIWLKIFNEKLVT